MVEKCSNEFSGAGKALFVRGGGPLLKVAVLNVFDGLVAKIRVVQLGVMPALFHQGGVRSLGDDLAVIKDDDPVGMLDRPQPVGDDDRCPALHDGLQSVLDLRLGEGINACGCLVQDEDAWILQ